MSAKVLNFFGFLKASKLKYIISTAILAIAVQMVFGTAMDKGRIIGPSGSAGFSGIDTIAGIDTATAAARKAAERAAVAVDTPEATVAKAAIKENAGTAKEALRTAAEDTDVRAAADSAVTTLSRREQRAASRTRRRNATQQTPEESLADMERRDSLFSQHVDSLVAAKSDSVRRDTVKGKGGGFL